MKRQMSSHILRKDERGIFMTTVFLAGGFGKMGVAIQNMLAEQADLTLVGILGRTPHEATVPVF